MGKKNEEKRPVVKVFIEDEDGKHEYVDNNMVILIDEGEHTKAILKYEGNFTGLMNLLEAMRDMMKTIVLKMMLGQ